MKIFSLFFSLLFSSYFTFAQESKRVSYDQLGISFVIPLGWQPQEINQGILLQKPGLAGFIFASTHNQSLEELKADALKPLNDGQGTNLQLSDSLQILGSNAIAGHYQGLLEGSPAKCYIIGMENPTGGLGITIIAASEPDLFSEQLQEVAFEFASSFQFEKVDKSSEIQEWKSFLSGMRLTYMETYNSPSYSDGGISGGYNIKRTIDLCPQGHFNSGNSSSFQMDGLGRTNSNQKGQGTWDIVLGMDGMLHLELKDYTGEIRHYRLEYLEEKLYLNGERYFRTDDGDNAPYCN
ncbi:hypothetical protein [Algoriphagus sp. A40]|uniref:hypothetical protein n=1 Tax=Algoriphagus sp. A40 TaxID=1945863 RepID=UPI000984ADF9|nr:hypothetical protein [Algoriphagus sp. A40]OOG72187.1 hypothetical protein B0E43_16295 [Algoriphagus sp. A40]